MIKKLSNNVRKKKVYERLSHADRSGFKDPKTEGSISTRYKEIQCLWFKLH